MAACASSLICFSSRSRAAEAWFLVVGIASPTTTAFIATLQTGSTHRHKIMGDDAPAKVSFKSNLTFIKSSLHAKAVFERTQARFNACSPALATPEPALFLSRSPAGAQTPAGGQNHLLDSQLGRSLFVGGVPEAPVSCSQSRCSTE